MDYNVQAKSLILVAQYFEGTGIQETYVQKIYKAAESITKLLARAEAAEALLKFWEGRCKEATLRAEKAERFASNLCDLCDDFTDYVTSGVPNAAPYCANQCQECVNGRGWCTWGEACRGFYPKAAKRQEADEHGKV